MAKQSAKRAPRKSLRTEKKDDKRGTNPNSLANLNPFQKGVSGNPGGRPKLLSDAYREYLGTADEATGRTRAQDIARAQGVKAIQGDVAAAREMRSGTEGDRIRTWRDDVIDLLRARTVTPAEVTAELGDELATELIDASGVRRNENSETESARAGEPSGRA